ncbi:hypothetical protein CQ018_18190 [Arthrobacter sp. MYb227]|uniref:DUF1697 domain-containing protein n=1 Tax=Arthrobacter sp. MYb227 TaxID=1848601 RepID=UPI000CFAE646|nr:DUF1697 domain-containing protein [Arthrobacter sp. MYb227]PQZ86969.1 hypothetical protein CQ018_18190 [Arthrobacter sp. MYb227]
MYHYAVFLRGINVGGVKILMKDLTQLFEQAGFSRVRTLLASGNVVFASQHATASKIKEICEEVLARAYAPGIKVIVQDSDQLEAIVTGFPFSAPQDSIQRHEYLVLTESLEAATTIFAQAPTPLESERVAQLEHCICWEVPRGQSLSSPLAKHFAKVSKNYLVTTRNMNTINKACTALKLLSV